MQFGVIVPRNNERGPQYMEQALAAIHQAASGVQEVVLGFEQRTDGVELFARCPDRLDDVMRSQLYAQYPNCHLADGPDELRAISTGTDSWQAELVVVRDIFPIKRHPQFEDQLNRTSADPLTAILTALASGRANSLDVQVEIRLRSARHRRRRRAESTLHRLNAGLYRRHPLMARAFIRLRSSPNPLTRLLAALLGKVIPTGNAHSSISSLTTSASRLHDREEDLQAAADKLGRPLFECQIQLTVWAPPRKQVQAEAKLREIAAAFGQFSSPRLAAFDLDRIRRRTDRRITRGRTFLLSTEEVATLWHPPTMTVRAPKLAAVQSREFEPPVTLPTPSRSPGIAVLGMATFRGHTQFCGILPDDRRKPIALLGKTGMGKSTLMLHLALADLRSDRPLALLDPHGDLAEALLQHLPRRCTNKAVLFDAGDRTHPLSFNPLVCRRPEDRPLVASGIVSAFKKLFAATSWGPRLEFIFHHAVLAMTEIPCSTFISVLRLLSDAHYRSAVMPCISDPLVRNFWEHEFARLPQKLQVEAVAPIQNKLGQCVASPILRNIFGQANGTLDLRRVMDESFLIVNLAKGRIGEDASSLLGALLVTNLQIAAMGRADQPEAERRDFNLYVDEFQNYATDSFATILSEARKYHLSLTVANQYLAQLDEQTLHALFGNIGTLVSFQAGPKDAELLAEQFGGDVTPQDLLGLPKHRALVRLSIDGMPSQPFSLATLPPPASQPDPQRAEIVRRTSRQRYARPAATVEREIEAALAA